MVLKQVESGIPGVALREGDHICAIYHGARERDELLVGFLRAGLTASERCICVVDSVLPSHVSSLLEACGCTSGPDQLQIMSSRDTYLRLGRFDPDTMLKFWQHSAEVATGHGYPLTRAVGEMTWALKALPGVQRLIEYEARLNRILSRHPQVILCLYDLERFGGDVVMSLMRTHPRLLVNGMLVENPYYTSPEEFLARD